MKKLTSICTACLFVSGVVSAQQPHVHGKGKLLVGQEGQTWELMFEIPAANALGFEYLPTNDAEIAKIESYIEAVQNNTGLVDAGDSCRLACCWVQSRPKSPAWLTRNPQHRRLSGEFHPL